MFQKLKEKRAVVFLVAVVVVASAAFLAADRPAGVQPLNIKDLLEQAKGEVIENGKRIEGSVVSVTDATITVRTQIVDLASLFVNTESGFTQGAKNTEKDITVSITAQTVFEGVTKSEIKEGSIVRMTLDASVYEQESPTALTVELFDLKTQVVKEVTQRDMIAGKVLSVRGKTLTIETEVADEEKLDSLDTSSGSFTIPYVTKTYTVTITDTTEFLEGKTSADIVPGTRISAWGEGNVYSINRFNATKIYLMP